MWCVCVGTIWGLETDISLFLVTIQCTNTPWYLGLGLPVLQMDTSPVSSKCSSIRPFIIFKTYFFFSLSFYGVNQRTDCMVPVFQIC